MPAENIFDKNIRKRALKIIDEKPEVFAALEEYDRTRVLRKWDNKVRVNFTLNPDTYKKLKQYSRKSGIKMSTLIENLVAERVGK